MTERLFRHRIYGMSKTQKKADDEAVRGRPRLGEGLAKARSFYVPDDEWDEWRSVASEHGITVSHLIRKAMVAELKRLKRSER